MSRIDSVWADQIQERIQDRVRTVVTQQMEQAKAETVPIQAFLCGAVAGLLVTVADSAGLLVGMRRGEPPPGPTENARSDRIFADLVAALWGIMDNEIGEPGVAAQFPWPDAERGN